ncbi:RNA 2'-phosphotransferase [Pseudoflavonifractor phocaeensis]|uniref:RNA 2'-phosphotransferase n=1 Tax=Pseudoflavonifractor phocaeensis TaxID=1870988 RepID=UPI0019597E69|nr:RNA 2'-phosphotransferase [Pseudoflavonifractor phocaeensis]MBM6869558.1 RNA 2'-phosphotransferase [Pseudoflavonifractor phocaeensis]MBM6939437.1 RNA 2'-phosphotransferase [Pseudoflavonifractor phocaeensis]
MDLTRASRCLSRILRHAPESVGISLDRHGWAEVDALLAGMAAHTRYPLDRATLEEIVRTDEKGRYAFDQDHSHIRANQGHSIPVDVELEECLPPEALWHGTGKKYERSIDASGLLPKGRLYVHLSLDRETAMAVGARHGAPVLYRVKSGQMARDGLKFYRSVNKVWLTKVVPTAYLEKEST